METQHIKNYENLYDKLGLEPREFADLDKDLKQARLGEAISRELHRDFCQCPVNNVCSTCGNI